MISGLGHQVTRVLQGCCSGLDISVPVKWPRRIYYMSLPWWWNTVVSPTQLCWRCHSLPPQRLTSVVGWNNQYTVYFVTVKTKCILLLDIFLQKMGNWLNGAYRPAAIAGATIRVFLTLKLIWSSSTYRWNLPTRDFQMSCYGLAQNI